MMSSVALPASPYGPAFDRAAEAMLVLDPVADEARPQHVYVEVDVGQFRHYMTLPLL